MATLGLTVAIVWGASVVFVALAGIVICRQDSVRSKGELPRRGGRTRRLQHSRFLEPDHRLLVPWSAVRASKRRMGVERSIFIDEIEDAPADVADRPDRQRRGADPSETLSKAV